MQRVADGEPRAETVERVRAHEIEVASGHAVGGPPILPAGKRRVGRITLQVEGTLVDMPVDDLVAPEIVEIGQQDGAVRHRRMHVAVDGALGDHHHSIAVLAIASTGGGTANDCATMRAMSSPDNGSTSSLLR